MLKEITRTKRFKCFIKIKKLKIKPHKRKHGSELKKYI